MKRVGRSVVIVSVVFAACTSTSPALPTPAGSTSGAAAAPGVVTPAAASGPLKIGILVPFTESAIDGDEGASQRRAADLYLKVQGGKLGGRDVQLVYNDESALDPETNRIRIDQFLKQDHVDVLLGGLADPAAVLLRDAADAAKVVYIDTNATLNELTRVMSSCTPTCRSAYVFRATLDAWQMSEPLGEWVAKAGRKDAYAVYADDTFGVESEAAFAEGLAKNGGAIAAKAAVAPKSGADWLKIVGAIKAQPTKTVFAAFITDDAAGFITAWAAAGMAAAGYRLFGPGPLTDSDVLKTTKQAAAGATTAFSWSEQIDTVENKAFVDAFAKAYTAEDTGMPLVPDGYAVEMWDTMRALDGALTATHGDASALVLALTSASVKTPSGDLAFDASTHAATLDVYIREVRSTGTALVNAIVDRVPRVVDPGR